ncbi:MAG TPA: ABATE domain-containing protein [Lichenihabitans sp.]|nr:ABATE domain-containing protein [Lichenihabitans sp.]
MPPSRAGSLPLIGGVLAFDFCNTSSGRGTPDHQDHLRTIDNLVAWARHVGVLDAAREARLRHRCDADAAIATRLFERALRLRDAIYDVDTALVQGRTPDQPAIDVVAATHADCLANGRLTTRDGGFGWTWEVDQAPEEAVLGPIAASAMAIITAADRARLKQCQGHHCGWLFLDTTKSSNRRWCEMEVCGNRAKQKRRRGRQAGR